MSFRPKGEISPDPAQLVGMTGLGPSLSVFAPWREEYANPQGFDSRMFFASETNSYNQVGQKNCEVKDADGGFRRCNDLL